MVRAADAVGELPKVFIASSSPGLPVARALSESISRQLKRRVAPRVWDKVFELSQTNIENLESEVEAADFAIAVLTADDKRVKAGEEIPRAIPRDNVIFEIGLFMGRLGRKRCLLVQDDQFDLQLPSDLAGLATARFKYDAEGLGRALLPAGKAIAECIRASPIRTDKAGLSPEANLPVTRAFCRCIAGFWWSVRAWDRTSLGLVEISGDAQLGTLHVSGNAYRANGQLVAHWDSDACAANAREACVYYHFTGWEPEVDSQQAFRRLEGMTQYLFDAQHDRCDRGKAEFVDQVRNTNERLQFRSALLLRLDSQESEHARYQNMDALVPIIAERLAAR
jgi:hypothetical protein